MKVLFVCMGNICRSPAAEAIFRAMVDQAGLSGRIHCDSAGTIGYHAGGPADSRMRAAAAGRGYNVDSISRKVQLEDFSRFDHIVAMDLENLEALEALQRQTEGPANLSLMCDFASKHNDREVPDPYYGGSRGFEHVLDLLEDACEGLLKNLDQA